MNCPVWSPRAEAIYWLNEIEKYQGGANGPTIKLRAAIMTMRGEKKVNGVDCPPKDERNQELAAAARAELAKQSSVGQQMEDGLKAITQRFGHTFWGAGEADCPKDIKAPNGELFELRCKKCGQDNPKSKWCNETEMTKDYDYSEQLRTITRLDTENAKLASEGRGGAALLAIMVEQRDKAEAARDAALLGLVEAQDYAKTEYLQREKLEAENALFYSELVKLRGMLHE